MNKSDSSTLRLDVAAAKAVFDCLEPSLRALALAGGLNPARDFRGANLRGWPLAEQDVRGFDFSRADLRETGIESALTDSTTILLDAVRDAVLIPKDFLEDVEQDAPLIPEDFLEQARAMILANEKPPAHWTPHITMLDFNDTQLESLTPLAHLTELKGLYLRGTRINDLSPLVMLTGLQSLGLGYTEVSGLDSLKNLGALKSIDISHTPIFDLDPLRYNMKLRSIYLGFTEVNDINVCAYLPDLLYLDLRETQVKDISMLSNCELLKIMVDSSLHLTELKNTLSPDSKVEIVTYVESETYYKSVSEPNCESTRWLYYT